MAELRESMTRAQFNVQLRAANKKLCKNGADLNRALRSIVDLTDMAVREMVLVALNRRFEKLLKDTPIYTGRAIAAWQIVTARNELEYAPGESPQEIAAAMIRAIPEAMSLKRADKIWVINNVKYILALNAGWSKQAPAGFIDNFVLGLSDDFNKIASDVNKAR